MKYLWNVHSMDVSSSIPTVLLHESAPTELPQLLLPTQRQTLLPDEGMVGHGCSSFTKH